MAEIPEVEKYEISDKFEELSFGCLEKAAGYGKSKDICTIFANSSSISAFISGVIKEGLAKFTFIDPKLSPLHNHFVAYNDGDRTIYLRGEIRFDSLDKGQELSEYTMKHFRPYGLPGDSVSQFIPKWIGGYDSGDNAFNLHSSADTKQWKDALSKSYEHIKKDEKNTVRFINIIYFKEWDIRPSEIFFNFKLYSSSDKEPVETIEGRFLNPLKSKC